VNSYQLKFFKRFDHWFSGGNFVSQLSNYDMVRIMVKTAVRGAGILSHFCTSQKYTNGFIARAGSCKGLGSVLVLVNSPSSLENFWLTLV